MKELQMQLRSKDPQEVHPRLCNVHLIFLYHIRRSWIARENITRRVLKIAAATTLRLSAVLKWPVVAAQLASCHAALQDLVEHFHIDDGKATHTAVATPGSAVPAPCGRPVLFQVRCRATPSGL